jgi:hypothetical protein
MSRYRIVFGPNISKRVKARISYSFRVFCAVYGHSVANDHASNSAIPIHYGTAALPPGVMQDAIHIPARYVERPSSEPAPKLMRFLYADEWFDLFFGVDNLGRPDWLGEIFEWISSADEISEEGRDAAGRIPYEKSIFSRQEKSPIRPRAILAMAWLEGYLRYGRAKSKLVKAPSPVDGTDHFVICSHDIDIHWTQQWRWRERVKRQLKNALICPLESRSASVLISSTARLLKSLLGMRVDDFIPLLLEAARKKDFQSTLFVIANSVHRRDANYQLEQLVPRLREAVLAGFDVDLHASYTSIVEKCDLRSEADLLSKHTHRYPSGNRQHWLRFDSHHKLFSEIERARLLYDSTLGFSNQVGFRNGACFAFPPYNFVKEEACNFLEIPLAIMDRALLHASRSSGRSYANLTDEVLEESRRFGWGGISMLWHNPVEDVYVPREVNQILWDRIRDKNVYREKWVSASTFLAASLARYQAAGLLQNVGIQNTETNPVNLHAQPANC